jgi:hypothetical protein
MCRLDTFWPLTVGSIGSIRSGAIGTVGSMEYDGRRPRVPKVLAERIDRERGQVPFERWVREALEQALERSDVASEQKPSQAPVAPVRPSSPAPARAPEPERPYELPKIAKRK